MLSIERYPGLAPGPQRLADCYYREREAPPPVGLFPTSCDMAARAPPPRAQAPPPVPTETAGKEQVKMELENASLWKQFSAVGTEMIITKKGRRMFPGLSVKLSGLNPALRYILLLDVVPLDSSRYRFQGDAWQTVGEAEARLPDRVFIHPDSPATGAHWLGRSVAFHRAKLTNHTLDSQGHIILHFAPTGYQPRLHIMEARDICAGAAPSTPSPSPRPSSSTVTQPTETPGSLSGRSGPNPFCKRLQRGGGRGSDTAPSTRRRLQRHSRQRLVLARWPQLETPPDGCRDADPLPRSARSGADDRDLGRVLGSDPQEVLQLGSAARTNPEVPERRRARAVWETTRE
ncbi:unnamed protein product [Arctogadus glacialis]